MRLEINRLEGLRNDLALRLEREEIFAARLNVANRDRLMTLAGIPRHREVHPEEERALAGCKILVEEHLHSLGLVDETGKPRCRAVVVSNRNLGTNHGNVAWQRGAQPPIFRIQEDPCNYGVYSCLSVWRDGRISIEDLRFDFDGQKIYSANPTTDGRDLSEEIEWATFGQRVVRDSGLIRIEEIIGQFYDLRHALAFDHHKEKGSRVRADGYRDYPLNFRENAWCAWRNSGVPRARYYHNAIGVSRNAIFIVQREGTLEEIGEAMRAAGAEDAIILDNGGSVVCWTWWANQYRGGILSPTVDYRPPGTSAIAFVIKGPVRRDLPGGSVSYSVI
jgi:hypothetical protein